MPQALRVLRVPPRFSRPISIGNSFLSLVSLSRYAYSFTAGASSELATWRDVRVVECEMARAAGLERLPYSILHMLQNPQIAIAIEIRTKNSVGGAWR